MPSIRPAAVLAAALLAGATLPAVPCAHADERTIEVKVLATIGGETQGISAFAAVLLGTSKWLPSAVARPSTLGSLPHRARSEPRSPCEFHWR